MSISTAGQPRKVWADESLTAAVQEMDDGLIDVNLGGGIYKQRVATEGGGLRTLGWVRAK